MKLQDLELKLGDRYVVSLNGIRHPDIFEVKILELEYSNGLDLQSDEGNYLTNAYSILDVLRLDFTQCKELVTFEEAYKDVLENGEEYDRSVTSVEGEVITMKRVCGRVIIKKETPLNDIILSHKWFKRKKDN